MNPYQSNEDPTYNNEIPHYCHGLQTRRFAPTWCCSRRELTLRSSDRDLTLLGHLKGVIYRVASKNRTRLLHWSIACIFHRWPQLAWKTLRKKPMPAVLHDTAIPLKSINKFHAVGRIRTSIFDTSCYDIGWPGFLAPSCTCILTGRMTTAGA